MGGLAATLFFSVTGLTLNHTDWTFGSARRQAEVNGALEQGWLASGADDAAVARLEIVEFLRQAHGIRGALEEFRVDEDELLVAFKGPGYAADAFIDRRTGSYEGVIAHEGWVAVMNDLHKGRYTGTAWSWVIDISAVVLAVVSLTGLLLMIYLRRRRLSGLVTAAGGLVACAVVVWLLVR